MKRMWKRERIISNQCSFPRVQHRILHYWRGWQGRYQGREKGGKWGEPHRCAQKKEKLKFHKFHSHRDLWFYVILLARKVGKEGRILDEEIISEFVCHWKELEKSNFPD